MVRSKNFNEKDTTLVKLKIILFYFLSFTAHFKLFPSIDFHVDNVFLLGLKVLILH